MSAAALQRVVVRLLHDPSFVARVYAEPERALADLELTADERRWLVTTDRRRFEADPLRPRRVLKALLDEFRVSTALVVHATRRLASLERFFQSPEFHGLVEHRGSLARAFPAYLRSLAPEPRVGAVLAVEEGLAAARRGRLPAAAERRFDDESGYLLSSHVEPLLVPAGTVAVMQAVEQVLFELSLVPVAALAEDGPDLRAVPGLGSDHEAFVAELGADGQARLGGATPALVSLLEAARRPIRGEALRARARELGADPGEDEEIVSGLVADGLLVAAPR